jgi:hypothetical protein
MIPMLHRKTLTAKPIATAAGQVTLVARAVHWQLGDRQGGLRLSWLRPVAVEVENQDGERRRIPVRDVTRLAQVTLLAAGIAGAWLVSRLGR